jgi:enolase
MQVMPLTARTMAEALAITFEIVQCAAELVSQRWGTRLLTTAEGGLVFDFPTIEAMFETAVAAIQAAGYKAGADVALTVDVAASQFYQAGYYRLGQQRLDGAAMVEQLLAWLKAYPLAGVEDGLAEDDWDHWVLLRRKVTKRTLILGDDLLCTNPIRIQRAIRSRAANGLLLKVNQIGTLTEAAEAHKLARSAGWRVVIGARSGETEDDWLADLAVGWGGDHIKVGAISQSERLAKYNRLLAIEAATALPLA